MNVRQVVLGLLCGVVFGALVSACGEKPKCGSECGGCCDEAGVCRAGNDVSACGSGADACRVCASPLLCEQGVCTEPSGGAEDAGQDAGVVDAGIFDGGVIDAGPPTTPVGGACDAGNQCLDGQCLTQVEDGFSGGYCTAQCSPMDECPAGSSCGFNPQHCLADCAHPGTGRDTCRDGYVCERYLLAKSSMFPDAGSCFPACTDDMSATATGHCDKGYQCGAQFFKCCDEEVPIDGGVSADGGVVDAGTMIIGTCPVGGTCRAHGYCL